MQPIVAQRSWCFRSASSPSIRAGPGRQRQRLGRPAATNCERRWASSVDVGGPLIERLVKACAEQGTHVAIGVNECEDESPGSLYNTLLILGAEGVLHRHRKLMPTMHERCSTVSAPETIWVLS